MHDPATYCVGTETWSVGAAILSQDKSESWHTITCALPCTRAMDTTREEAEHAVFVGVEMIANIAAATRGSPLSADEIKALVAPVMVAIMPSGSEANSEELYKRRLHRQGALFTTEETGTPNACASEINARNSESAGERGKENVRDSGLAEGRSLVERDAPPHGIPSEVDAHVAPNTAIPPVEECSMD